MLKTASMTGLWLEDKKLEMRELPIPSPVQGEALVRLRLAGICGTDLELVRGYYPYTGVPGHEFVGEVIDAPSDPSWVGRRVVGEINASCKECDTCLTGRPTHCERRTVLGIVGRDGVFAEYFTLPVGNLLEVHSSIPDEAAVFTEPLAAACQILEQVPVESGNRVLLIGAGRLGQLIARVLSLEECTLQVLARYATQEALLNSHGISTIGVEDISDRSIDVAIEATGDPGGFELAVQAVRPRGTIVMKSTYHGKVEVDFSALVVDEVTLVGSRCGPFERALDLMESSKICSTDLIAKTYPLGQSLEAFDHAAKHGALKVLLDPRLD